MKTETELGTKKAPLQNRKLERCRSFQIDKQPKKLTSRNKLIKYCLFAEEIFGIIVAIHVDIGDRGRDKLKTEISIKYANITIEVMK